MTDACAAFILGAAFGALLFAWVDRWERRKRRGR